MLKTLNIENIAVIEKAEIDFSKGLNVLTGETGAGKSIVIDSINAILGERTSREVVRHGAESGFVSAYFENISTVVDNLLEEYGVPFEDDKSLLISRKISTNGKSVCKINGSTVTASILKNVGRLLVNIHGQHDSQTLLNPDYHYNFIDILNENKSILSDFQASFKDFMAVRKRLKALTLDEDSKDRKLELLNYQINEIEDADIKIGEKDELLKMKSVVLNSESISKAISETLFSINGDDEFAGISNMMNTALNSFESLSSIDKELAVIYENISSIVEKIDDTAEILKDKNDNLNFDSSELERIEERLDLIYKLSSKYGETEQHILDYLEQSIKERDSILHSDEELENLTTQYDILFEKAVKMADKLNAERTKTAKKFENSVKSELDFLDMPNVKFIVNFEKGKLSSNGYDKIEFLISTNTGEPPKPLAKIASGGELSRIMLAIKNIIAHNDTVDTLIFDEIDTGVSGRASQKIGIKLKSVSKSCQVVCVTHSAQIASNADNHLLIEKDVMNNRTYTKVTPLDFEGRKNELARIMGGIEITPAMLNSAEELLLSQDK